MTILRVMAPATGGEGSPGRLSRGGAVVRARSKFIAVAGISLAVAIGVTGCGQVQKLSAKDSVSDALSNFESAKSATFTVSLDTTAADIAAISKAEGDAMSAADQKTAAKVLAGDVVFAVEAAEGKTFGDSAKNSANSAGSSDIAALLGDPEKLSKLLKEQGAFSMSVRLSGDALVDLRSVDGKIFARADVNQILTLAGQDPSLVDQQLAGLPPALAPLAKAAKGEWVSLDLIKAAGAAKEKGLLDAIPTSAPTPSVDAAKLQKLMDSLKKAYQDKATITDLGENDDRGQGYRLGAPAKQVADAVSPDLIALVGKESEADVRKAITEIPDKTFNVDLWVKDDNLSAISLDLIQFMDKPVTGRKLAVDIDVDVNSGAVEVPTGANEIDIASLLSEIPAGALSGGAGLPSGAGGAGAGAGSTELTAEQKAMLEQSGMTEKQIQDLIDAQAGQ
jgi:hypothetical protein